VTTFDASLVRIDTLTGGVSGSVPLGVGFPLGIALAPGEALAYVAISKEADNIVTSGANRVAVVDLAAATVTATIPLAGTGATAIVLSPDGTRAYVSDRFANRLDVISTATNSVITSITLSGQPVGLALTASGSLLYVAPRLASRLVAIDTATNAGVASITIAPALPNSSSAHVALAPDGKRAYVTHSASSRLAVIDTDPASATYHQQVGMTDPKGGAGLTDVDVSADNRFVFASHSGLDGVAIYEIDPLLPPDLLKRIALAPTGADPFSVVAGGPLGTIAWTANVSGASVTRVGVDDFAIAEAKALAGQ
jgi:YVTN family beta-propeller protein